jgi:phosphate starvation-inducible PhoH-like protein
VTTNTKAERRATKKRPTRPVQASRQQIPESYMPKAKNIEITPKNAAQARYLDALYDDGRDILISTGPAGTGKTFMPSLYAIRELKEGTYKRIIITRPIVPNGEDLGFLPGDLIEKLSPWVRPILDVFQEVMSLQEIEAMIVRGTLEIAPLSMMRGRTLKNAFIIADEMQNATKSQLKMLMTRISYGSRMVITGDLEQRDRIDGECGLNYFLNEYNPRRHQRFSHIEFGKSDIERHPIISDVLDIFGD